jgi:hypothetical protein
VPKDDIEATLEADGLRVVFYRHGDRIAHRIEVVDSATNDWLPAFTSVEGMPDDSWPPSPPFQQLHVEERPTGSIVFLIGMAGRSHWSAAIDVSTDRRSIRFDVAIRYASVPQKLGSTYAEKRPMPYPPLVSLRTDHGSYGEHYDELGSFSHKQMIPRQFGEGEPLPAAPATVSWKYEARALRP